MASTNGVKISNISQQGEDSTTTQNLSENKGKEAVLSQAQTDAVATIAQCGDKYLNDSKDIRVVYNSLLNNPSLANCNEPPLSFTTPLNAALSISKLRQAYEKLGIKLAEEDSSDEMIQILAKAVELGSANIEVYQNLFYLGSDNNQTIELLFSGIDSDVLSFEDRLKVLDLLDQALFHQSHTKACNSENCITFFSYSTISDSAGIIDDILWLSENQEEDFRKHPDDTQKKYAALSVAQDAHAYITDLLKEVDATIAQGYFTIDPDIIEEMKSRETDTRRMMLPNYEAQFRLAQIMDKYRQDFEKKLEELEILISSLKSKPSTSQTSKSKTI